MSTRGSVLRESVRSGNCPFGEISAGKVSVGEVSVGDLSSGKFQLGKCPVGNILYVLNKSFSVRLQPIVQMEACNFVCLRKI